MMQSYPILYSFRRCPYAMRARIALYASSLEVELREIQFANKPPEMLLASPKGTVPVLVTLDNAIIDESLDIMRWALSINDPHNWLAYSTETISEMDALIRKNDTDFKEHLDHYKYADRFPAFSETHYRQQGEVFLMELEQRLKTSRYLFADQMSFADIAVFPFIRQFASVDKIWFEQSQYHCLRTWLEALLVSDIFVAVMIKYPSWKSGDKPIVFSPNH